MTPVFYEKLCVSAAAGIDPSSAEALADHLKVRFVDHETWKKEAMTPLLLLFGENGLSLTDGTLFMQGDLTSMLPRIKPGRLSTEMLLKAAKIKGQAGGLAVDATAGMGEDSVILAAGGFEVRMFEYDPVIAALLRDSLMRARNHPELTDVAMRMHLTEGSSIEGMKDLGFTPDVILLDPMFPERRKSALVKKKFQLLHHLEQPASDEKEMLEAARAAGAKKIVIKRPLKGPYLADVKPSHSYSGKAIRYDCIV